MHWIAAEASEDTGIGIDAPILKLGPRMRISDRLAQSYYGKYHSGGYPGKKTRTFSKTIRTFSAGLTKLGFDATAGCGGRFWVQVHPWTAVSQLLFLKTIVECRKGNVADRAGELRRLRTVILDRLPSLTPKLAIAHLPEILERGRELKAAEDQFQALLAAYMAAYQWFWGRSPSQQNEPTLDADPILQFEQWFAEAHRADIHQPGAATLATVSADGQPSARMVIVQEANADGFVFYTNYRSQKGRDLAANPKASLVFYWPELHRQVRVSGQVSKTTQIETEDYFRTRPRGAQLSAWASWQSSVIPDREVLDRRVNKVEARFAGREIPPPPGWGGFRLHPETIEFWQGRENRLHDRLRYSLAKGRWIRERLAP